jgi:hypothetical protein
MKTLTMTDEQFASLLSVLDYVLDAERTSYEEWCDMGNDPTNHIWYHAADAASVLEQA